MYRIVNSITLNKVLLSRFHLLSPSCFHPRTAKLQSWTKVLEKVMQYSHFSVISGFLHNKLHPFRNFIAVLPPPNLCKVENRKKILDTCVQHCLWGEGRRWACVNWKTPQKCKSVPRLLPLIVEPTSNVSHDPVVVV